MEPKAVRRLQHLALPDAKLWPRAVVDRIAVRHDRVQPVVAARELDDHEDALGVALDAGAFKCLCRKRGGRAAQDDRQRGAGADAVESTNEEFAAGAATAGMCMGHKTLQGLGSGPCDDPDMD